MAGEDRGPLWDAAFQDYLEFRGPHSEEAKKTTERLRQEVTLVMERVDALMLASSLKYLLDNTGDPMIIAMAAPALRAIREGLEDSD